MSNSERLNVTTYTPDRFLAEQGESWLSAECTAKGVRIHSSDVGGEPPLSRTAARRFAAWMAAAAECGECE